MATRQENADRVHSPDPETAPDDATLARRVGQAAPGTDTGAEAELYRRLAPRVRLYGLRHLGNEAAAADLMQQVMLLLIERLRGGALREPERLASFVFGICRMTVLDLRRGQARRQRLLASYGEALLPPDAPAPEFDHDRLAHCLERLPERERSVLLLTFYNDMPAEALAHELKVSPANLRVIRHRGLRRLRTCISGEAS
jgi:RNA polymerase sigma-70 factor (ECF subfamily)